MLIRWVFLHRPLCFSSLFEHFCAELNPLLRLHNEDEIGGLTVDTGLVLKHLRQSRIDLIS